MDKRKEKIVQLLAADPRFGWEAYLFIEEAVQHTQATLGRQLKEGQDEPGEDHHLSARELCNGIRDLAMERYGPLAGAVVKQLGIRETKDVGDLVWNMVEHELLIKSDSDQKEDFRDLFDLREEFSKLDLTLDGDEDFGGVFATNARFDESIVNRQSFD